MPELIIFVVATVAAIRGADWVGKASITFAKGLGVSTFVVGATFVAIATTLPELTISFISGIVNSDPLFGLGNTLGSPIINLGLILGFFFIISRQRPGLGYYSRSINIFIIVSLLLFLVSLSRPIGGILSIFLILFGVFFLFMEFLLSQHSQTFLDKVENRFEKFISFFHLAGSKALVFEFIFGSALLLFGSKFMIDSGVSFANSLGVDSFFISATVLALGTSLPEIITMINSITRRRVDLSVGNLVGASVIDLTFGVGIATLTTSATIPQPFNYLFFLVLISIGIVSLLAVWPRFRVDMVGGLLFALAVSFLILISVWEFTFL